MRVAIINRHPRDVLGGSEMQCHNIAAGLARRGHEVAYIAPSGNGPYDAPYTVLPVPASSTAIASAVASLRPDVVYWRFNKYLFYRTARRIAGMDIPVVFAISHVNDTRMTSHVANPRAGLRNLARAAKQSVLTAFNHLGFRHVAAVTSLNPDYLGRLPVARQLFVPNSVELDSVAFSWPRPYLVWVANLKPAKRPELYAKLAQSFAGSAVDFLMVGEIQAQEYAWLGAGAQTGVHYLGKKSVQETNGIIGNALGLVHTCRPEGFGNNFLQAWLHGVPTVSLGFDPGGYIREFGLGGYAADDWETFKTQVARLIDSREASAEAGRRARIFAEARFSIDRTVETLEQFLREVVADQHPVSGERSK